MKTLLFIFCYASFTYSTPVLLKAYVVGSVEVESILRFPYQTAIFSRFDSGSAFCSGSILSATFVITCAHCLIGSKSASVYYGSDKLSALDFNRNQVIDQQNYRIHPEYSSFRNDIALMKMNAAIVFGDSVKPLRLPNSDEITETYNDRKLVMASWGLYSDANILSDSLRFIETEITTSSECAQVYPPILITRSVICSRVSHCSGDSGSMLVNEVNEGDFVAVGIASFSYDLCSGAPSKPSVFMRVSSYLNFIHDNSDLDIL